MYDNFETTEEYDETTVSLEGEKEHETKQAVKFLCDGISEWIPKSQIVDEELIEVGVHRLEVMSWIAREKGFIC